ncbi:MAG: hypothetical protein D6785_01000 [Planctomycetota bacterium]|nr:MAG: hypothetical protein D6785_01000 [Planctomycetota bacterium]
MDLKKLDQYASVFRGAIKEPYQYEKIKIDKILLVDDNPRPKAEKLLDRVQRFLSKVTHLDQPEWLILAGDEFQTISDLLEKCKEIGPSMIVTYRHLKQPNKNLPYSIGVYLDMLTQATPFPVLVLPYFADKKNYENTLENTNSVTVIADHLTGDHRLVNYGVYFTEEKGDLFLTHVENKKIFEKYMNIIAKIPEIPTDIAREKIYHQLLKEPSDYIQACKQKLEELQIPLNIHSIVTMGHTLKDYKEHISNHRVDLLIMNTKDDEQLAMQGMAYSLVVELKEIPLLLL